VVNFFLHWRVAKAVEKQIQINDKFRIRFVRLGALALWYKRQERAKYDSDTFYPVSEIRSFFKTQYVTLWPSNRCFGGQKWRGNPYFKNIVVQGLRFNF